MGALAGALVPLAAQPEEGFLTELAAQGQARGQSELPAEVAAALGSVAAVSPFLKHLILSAGPTLDDVLSSTLTETVAAASRFEGEPKRALRRGKARVALAVALADLCGGASVADVTDALSAFADAAISHALAVALGDSAPSGIAADSCGLFVVAMGKLGARELNFSSDIDLVVLFEPAGTDTAGLTPKQAVRLTKRMVTILQERTADDYVFRVDLRLRPDPGSTPIAVTTHAALRYYQSRARAWERQAMIKARVVAGDHKAGARYMAAVESSVWRNGYDFNAIDETMDMRQKIAAVKGAGAINVAGHDIKLGRGGIREIEFFVQSLQRVAGGRDKRLRGRATVPSLAALARGGWVDHEVADSLRCAYERLRRIEHRIQMVNDEQNHTLPDDAGLDRIATMMREPDFHAQTLETLNAVHAIFLSLDRTDDHGAALPDIDEDVKQAFEAKAKTWREGKYNCLKTERSRALLARLEPAFLRAVAASADPPGALEGLDLFLARLSRGIDPLRRLQHYPELVPVLLLIVAAAPRLAEQLAARAHLLDVLVDPQFFGTVPTREALESVLDDALAKARDYEDALDALRIFGQEQRLLVEVRILTGSLRSADAGAAHTAVAEICTRRALDLAQAAFRSAHGEFPGGGVCLIGLGSFGGEEMTAASDLDLVFLYDSPKQMAQSNGAKPLSPGHYYTRLAQRFVSALSAPTAKGMLYQIDLRLRPSGKAGPLATHIRAFERYHSESAWTWEQMALTRARAVAGDDALGKRAMEAIAGALRRPRQSDALANDVASMRARMEQQKNHDMKHAPGGLIDIEFIAQFLCLSSGVAVTGPGTRRMLRHLSDLGWLDGGALETLLGAHRLIRNLGHLCAIAGMECPPSETPVALRPLLLRAADAPDIAFLEADLAARQRDVRALFERLIGPRR